MLIKFKNPYSGNTITETSGIRRDFLYFGWTGYPFLKRRLYGLAMLYFMTSVALLTMLVIADDSLFSGVAEFLAGFNINAGSRQILAGACIFYVVWAGYTLGVGKIRLTMLYLRRDYFIEENDPEKKAVIMAEWGVPKSAFLKENSSDK